MWSSVLQVSISAITALYLAAVGEIAAYRSWTGAMTAVLLDAKTTSETAAQANKQQVGARAANRIRAR